MFASQQGRGRGRTAEAAGEVEAVAVDADVGAQPVEPLTDALAHKRLRVVDVGRGVEVVAGARVAAAPEVAVVAADRVGVPVQAPPELHAGELDSEDPYRQPGTDKAREWPEALTRRRVPQVSVTPQKAIHLTTSQA